jgi:hypothetical protein
MSREGINNLRLLTMNSSQSLPDKPGSGFVRGLMSSCRVWHSSYRSNGTSFIGHVVRKCRWLLVDRMVWALPQVEGLG